MNAWTHFWQQSAAVPQLVALQWALLLAAACAGGYLLQRASGLPKVVGYTLVGTLAGLAGFGAPLWPLHGMAAFVIELGVALVLFECAGRIPLRWFRHNPMVLAQSLAESLLSFAAVYLTMRWLALPAQVASALALVAVAASPTVLTRVVADTRASGPVTERTIVLSTLSALYALALGSAQAGMALHSSAGWLAGLGAVLMVLGASVVVGAALALLLRAALRFMSPTSESTALLLLLLLTAATALAPALGGSAPLAALLGGMLLKQIHPRPWAWPRQMGTAASLVTLLMFVLVATVAAQVDWSALVAGAVLALLVARLAGKALGVGLANVGSGASWRQALWTAGALAPMSAVALLVTAQRYAGATPAHGAQIAAVALPAILLMEVLGAIAAAVAIYKVGESAKPWAAPAPTDGANAPGEQP